MRSILAACLILSCAHPAPSSNLDEGTQAAFNSNFTRARAVLAEVMAKDPDPKDRAKAAVRLANIQWRIDEHPELARQTLAKFAGDWDALMELARLEWTNHNWSVARDAATRARKIAKDAGERDGAVTAYATVVIESPDRDALRDAVDQLREVDEREPGHLTRALTLLNGAILLGDTDTMRVAWRSYFATSPRPDLSGDRMAMAQQLVDARLFEQAALLAPERKDVVQYAEWLRATKRRIDDYYRRTAQHDGVVQRDDRNAIDRELHGIAKPNEFGRFGTEGETGGRFNYHVGHRVLDESRQVEQYGRKATVRFVMLDTMISNGYESWVWDGHGQHGGWGDKGLIVQVRPAYAEGAVIEWHRLMDPEARKKADEELERESKKDEERAAQNPYAFLHGLALRLARQAEEHLLARVPDRARWVAELARMTQESSIFAHEGRHAIDAQYAHIRSDAERELRAKLSELAFGPDPRLALADGIIVPNVGSDSPHGQANLRIMKGLVEWMKAHAKLDPKRPVLPQLDTLTDEQLREAARSMDPWARVSS
ncbi:MAG TPA: hypothetical protein VJ901_16000 [Thermoanaerobaculia bacterium]|nr:hypothetical protein [Thermoanaerobaculia bacterium]